MSAPQRMAAIRAVFNAMFDAVDVAGDFDEGRWEDLIAAFNATGRLVFGWPHLESSESDIFGALDDIADQLEGTKTAITQTATEARIVLHELHKALDPLLPEPGGEPPAEQVSEPGPDEPEPPGQTERASIATGAQAGKSRGPYKKPYTSKDIAAYYETHTKDETAKRFNTSPATVARRVKEWEDESGQVRREGTAPRTPLRVVDLPPSVPAPKPEPETDGPTFHERRALQAKAAADRTWRERHGSA